MMVYIMKKIMKYLKLKTLDMHIHILIIIYIGLQ